MQAARKIVFTGIAFAILAIVAACTPVPQTVPVDETAVGGSRAKDTRAPELTAEASATGYIPTMSQTSTQEVVHVSVTPTIEFTLPSFTPTFTLIPTATATLIPPTATSPPPTPTADPMVFVVDEFINKVKNGNSAQVVGLIVENKFMLPVVQQPYDNPGYVSYNSGELTQFGMAAQMGGSIGILAHNFLDGANFFNVGNGEIIQVVYGDGRVDDYQIDIIQSYQALVPTSPYTDFKDLVSGEVISASTLFTRVYMGGDHVTLQTCIEQNGDDSWGRLFVMAYPLR